MKVPKEKSVIRILVMPAVPNPRGLVPSVDLSLSYLFKFKKNAEVYVWVPLADPGGPAPSSPQDSKSCSFQVIVRDKPYLSKFWAGGPLGSKLRWAP